MGSALGLTTWTGRGTFAPGIVNPHTSQCVRGSSQKCVRGCQKCQGSGGRVLQYYWSFFLDIFDISYGELCKSTSSERRLYICLRKLNQRRCFLCCQWTQFPQIRPIISKIELKSKQKVELRWGWKRLVGTVGVALSALPSTCVGGRQPRTTIPLQSTLRYNRIIQKYKHERGTRLWREKMHCAKEKEVFSAPVDFKCSFGLVETRNAAFSLIGQDRRVDGPLLLCPSLSLCFWYLYVFVE